MLVAARDHVRPHEGVPLADEGEDRDRRNRVLVHRDDDLPEELEVRAAVDLRGLEERRGHLREVLPEHEDVEAVGQRGQRNAQERVQQAQIRDRLVVLDDQHLLGHHHGQHEQDEKHVLEGEFIDGERVGAQNREQQRARDGNGADRQRIAVIEQERLEIPGVGVVLPLRLGRQPDRRDGGRFIRRLEGGEHHVDKREKQDQRADGQRGVFERCQNGAARIFDLHPGPSVNNSARTFWRSRAEGWSGS